MTPKIIDCYRVWAAPNVDALVWEAEKESGVC